MKVVRIIKGIFLTISIICLLVTCAGNFFILKDACDNGVTAEEVHAKLDDYNFKLKTIFSGKASAEGEIPNDTDDEALPASDENVENTAEPENDTVGAEDEGGYKAGSHIGIVNGLMKVGNHRLHLKFLDNISVNLCKFGVVGIRDGEFEVNTLLLSSVLAATVACILHLFSKKGKVVRATGRRSEKPLKIKFRPTAWSIILIVFGYILFAAFYAFGQILANIEINKLLAVAVEDYAAYRIYVVTGCTFMGFLPGLGFMRCGGRALKPVRK